MNELSPLAFEMLKYLCNTNAPGVYQSIDKSVLNIESQHDFLNALQELQSGNFILLSRDSHFKQNQGVEGVTGETVFHTENPENMRPISACINPAAGDICKEMDYYFEAGNKSGL